RCILTESPHSEVCSSARSVTGCPQRPVDPDRGALSQDRRENQAHPIVDTVRCGDYKQPAPRPRILARLSMDQALVSLASGAPLIDIDWTVLVQFGLFLLLLAVSNKLLFQPYLRLRERRKEGIDGARAEAERVTAQAAAKLADYEEQPAAA